MEASRRILFAFAVTCLVGSLASTASAADKELVSYRLASWQTMHFENPQQAQTHASTIKQLGCEVKTGQHGDHIDVSYRCSAWRQISLPSHQLAHQWESWLKASGFETKHQH